MIISARFIGKNSLGYETGKEYKLKVDTKGIWIKRLDGSGLCGYYSLILFLENWSQIKVISPQ